MSAIFGERLTFDQHEGDPVELVVYGDEFYARFETLDGFTVVYDCDNGCYCYAELLAGEFRSTGAPVWKRPPSGLRRHLRESKEVRNRKFQDRYDGLRPPEPQRSANVARTFGPNGGLLQGRRVNRGSVRGLTILVEFQDIHTDVSADDVSAMLNELDYSAQGNFCSVRRYYQLMSSGALDYTNTVVGPIRLSRRRSHYINNLLVQEALEAAIQQFGVKLEDYDSQDAGIVDALSVMYAGRTQYSGDLWPHNSTIGLAHGGARTHFYTIQSLGRRRVDLSIGTFTHESGHMLCRFPDLYDYGKRDGDFEDSAGLGRYCLMSSGNHLDRGRTPSPICVYLRDLAGWCTRQVSLTEGSEYQAVHGDYATALRFDTDKENEYFLIENRSQIDLDRHLPDGGLAVLHCDTRGSNEYQDRTPEEHYQCALLQADGSFHLERNTNQGDGDDLLDGAAGQVLGADTVPSTREWDGTASGFSVWNVGAAGQVVGFRTGAPADEQQVRVDATPDLVIPDDDPQGVKADLLVEPTGQLKSVRVRVDITHSYRGDLHVDLVTPSGTEVPLHRGQGHQLDDLHLDLASADQAGLAGLVGQPIAGNWQLHVRDLLPDDTGRLDFWSLEIEYDSQTSVTRGEARPNLLIPDANSAGVRSPIHVTRAGSLRSVRVGVEIEHSYVGDLQLELSSPAGQSVVLQAPTHENRRDLHASYDADSTRSLLALAGSEMEGTWELRVRDLVPRDAGRLQHWWIELES